MEVIFLILVMAMVLASRQQAHQPDGLDKLVGARAAVYAAMEGERHRREARELQEKRMKSASEPHQY